jgi:hypothetical protein
MQLAAGRWLTADMHAMDAGRAGGIHDLWQVEADDDGEDDDGRLAGS